MQTQTLTRAMPIVAAALGRKFGVQVVVGGAAAKTDGQTIWLPALDPDSALREVAWGFLAHEASHVRHTEMAVFQAVAAQSPLHQHLLNLLEDIRIERAIRRSYPGTQTTLAKVIDWMLADGQLTVPEPGDHPARILTAFLLFTLRSRVLGQTALAAPGARAEQVLRQTFPATLVHRLMGLASEVCGLASTAEAAELSAHILQLLEAETAEPPPPPSSSPSIRTDDPSDGQSENPSDDASDDPSDGQPDDGFNRASEPTSAPPSASQADDDADGGADGASNRASDDGDAASGQGAKGQAVQEALAAEAEDLPSDLFETARHRLERQSDSAWSAVLLPVGEEAIVDPLKGPALRTRVGAESRALSATLHGLVQASRLDRPSAVHQGKTLLASRLYRAGVGDPRLFARKIVRMAPNTAVHLLVDLSGSMSRSSLDGSLGQVAQDAALAFAMALDSIPDVSVAVTAFPGLHGDDDRVSCLIRHGQRPRARAGAFAQSARGGTPLAQALWFGAADLMPRPETRRVMLVMTDGDPDDADAALKVIAQCRQAGIEVAGVGIGYDVSRLFVRHLTIQSVSDLKRTLFGLAERFLI